MNNGKIIVVERYNAFDRYLTAFNSYLAFRVDEPDDFFAEMMNRLSMEYRIDLERVYVLGWSAGAAIVGR